LKKLIYIFILLPLVSQGQITFNQTYDINTAGSDLGGGVIEHDGFFYQLYSSPQTNGRQVSLLKVGQTGDTVSSKTLLSQANTVYYMAALGKGIVLSRDTTILLCGARVRDTISMLNDSAVAFAMRVDLNGNTIWYQEFGQYDNTWTYGRAILENPDGSIMLVAESDIPTNGGHPDVLLIQMDSAGNESWRNYYGGAFQDIPQGIVSCPSGGYYICGYWNLYSTVDDIDLFILKVDEFGLQQWLKFYGSDEDDASCSIQVLADSSILMIAGVGNPGIEEPDGYIAKIDTAGDTIWTRTYDRNDQTEYLYGTHPLECNDGGMLITGIFYDSAINDGVNAWLVRTDIAGNIQWERHWNMFGGLNQNYFWDMIRTSDNGILLSGQVSNFFAPTDNYSWLVKLDSNGCDSLGCPTPWVNAIEELTRLDLDFKVYPNPSTGLVNFQFSESYQHGQLQIYDIIGNLVFNQYENSEYVTLDFSSFKKGMYLIKMVAEDRKLSVRKLIIE